MKHRDWDIIEKERSLKTGLKSESLDLNRLNAVFNLIYVKLLKCSARPHSKGIKLFH